MIDENGLSNDNLTLSSFKGKAVLLEFMVSWCPHCQNMVPIIKTLDQNYSQQNLTIISVAATWEGANAESTAQFIRTYGTTWLHALDQKNLVFDKYGVNSTPTYFVIDPQGVVRFRLEGEQSYTILAKSIDEINS
jgi:thiol-disulfide isomerase/thioredoxin